MKFFSWQQLKDISISKKLYFIVGTMAVLILIELITLWFAIHTLSSVRALVGAEGLWSKAQKDALYELEKYYRTFDEREYILFQKYMAVPMGDHKTRLELLKENPDLNIARQGFIEGRVHPDDIDGMIKLLQRFHSISYINEAISTWTAGDSLIAELSVIGESMHREINSVDNPSHQKLDSIIEKLDPINTRLTLLEDKFSYTLGEGSRWLENLILKLLFFVALTVEITGLVLSIYVSRGIRKGLNEINRAASKVAKGDLTQRAIVFSDDEIGQTAGLINEMTQQLISTNIELGQFAYVASHDLQEPLRKIQTFVSIIKDNGVDQLSETSRVNFSRIQDAARRMQLLIDNLLSYSRLNKQESNSSKTDLNGVFEKVIEDMRDIIEEKEAVIISDHLPELCITEFQFQQLFSNIIGNSLKYKKENIRPEIKIKYERVNDTRSENGKGIHHKISFIDNGIGFESQYAVKIFELFQRLHGRTEYAGTGIGLAICKKIVENHGGYITANSETGKGAIFDIYLPGE